MHMNKRMNIRIAFFTEMDFVGKIPRNHENCRTEFAWMIALDADHYPLTNIPTVSESEFYDLGIAITPKNNPRLVNIDSLKGVCKKVGIMQEGPCWFFQDYDLDNQVHYINNLINCDIIFAHNTQDKKYYEGLVKHSDVRVLQSLMIEDTLSDIPTVERSGIMIGGNMVSWYGGMDSFILARYVTDDIHSPQMGRRQKNESQLGINQLPYLNWRQWMHELNKRKIGIHMMRTHAAGTFALNCAYLGIPCIGYCGLDTQRLLHPDLSVADLDMTSARNLVDRLWNDSEFYSKFANTAKEAYRHYYSEDAFLEKFMN